MSYQAWADYYGWKARRAYALGDFDLALYYMRRCLVCRQATERI